LVQAERQLLVRMVVIAAQAPHLAWCQQPLLVEVAVLLVLVAQILVAQQAVLAVAVLAAHLAH